MADSKTSALTGATALTGAELFPAVQGAASRKATAAQIATYVASTLGTAATLTVDTDGSLAANSDTRAATQKATKAYVDQIVASQDAMVFKGVIDCSANPNYPTAERGWTYRASVAGKIGGAAGVVVQVGDIILCLTDTTASGNQATVGSSWAVIQANIDGALTTADLGASVQPYDADLAAIAALVTTPFGRSVLTQADAAALRTLSGLGTVATLAVDTDTTLAADSDTRVPSQKAVKAAIAAGGGGASVVAVATPITVNGTTTAASDQLTAIAAMTGLAVGQELTGVGILAGTTISAVNVGASSLTLSQAASYSNTTPVTAYPIGTAGLVPAPPARAHARQVLGSDGQWKGVEPGPNLYKFDNPRRLRRYRAARGAISSGLPYADNAVANRGRNVLVFGDSPAIGNEPNIPDWRISPWYACANMLNAQSFGGIYRYDAIAENGNFAGVDPRIAMNGAWGGNGFFPGLPNIIANDDGDTADLIIAPSLPWKTMDIYWYNPGFESVWTWKIGGGSTTTVTAAGGARIEKLTITAPTLAVQSLTINRVSGYVRLASFNPYDPDKAQLQFVNLAGGGGGASALASRLAGGQLMSAANLKTFYDPALVIFHFGYEVAGFRSSPGIPAATMVANFIANLGACVSLWQEQDVDVMLMSMHPWDDTNLYKDQATVAQVREATYSIADTYDVPLIDNYARWGSWSEAVNSGFLSHYARPLPAGGHDLGFAAAQALSSF